MIAIIEGCGSNVASIQYALERLGKESLVTADSKLIENASQVIIPGVSTAQRAISQLTNKGLIPVIQSLQQPVLGICSGMQILYEYCFEGELPGLGIFSGEVKKLDVKARLPLPHMGWNTLQFTDNNCRLFTEVNNNSYVYFVHSFAAIVSEMTVASAEYGSPFSAVVVKKNFIGMQFHPERSGKIGMQLLRNFLLL